VGLNAAIKGGRAERGLEEELTATSRKEEGCGQANDAVACE